MAIEAKRGCGYRKVGGLYLVADPNFVECDRFPFNLLVCPTCGAGIKPSLGWTWVFPYNLFQGDHKPCLCTKACPMCHPLLMGRRAGLMWTGSSFYTPQSFIKEANTLGISKRIGAIPKGLELGKTWVLLAHRQAGEIEDLHTLFGKRPCPAIFFAFIPQRIEKIVTETQSKDEGEMTKLERRKITPVVVPDNDPDHQ